MNELSVTLPFKAPNLYGGLATSTGLARATPSELTLEFTIKDAVVNVLKSGVKEIRIPQAEIDSISYERGWWGDRVRIRVKSMKLLKDFPGSESAEATLRVARRHRESADALLRLLERT